MRVSTVSDRISVLHCLLAIAGRNRQIGRQSHGNTYKGKGKGLNTCYSAAYIGQFRNQQRFTISVVADDWCEPMVPQRIMWPPIARANGQLNPRCS